MNRSCHRQVKVFDLPVDAMIAPVPVPSADNGTIRARPTCSCGEEGAGMIASSDEQSVGVTVNGIPVRLHLDRTNGKSGGIHFWIPLVRSIL
jgi:hypothetical protein